MRRWLLIAGLTFVAPVLTAQQTQQATAPATSASASPSSSSAPAEPPDELGLLDPKRRSTRNTAYSLPGGKFAFDLGLLGVGGGDVFAKLGIAVGLGFGIQVEANLAHASVGLLNLMGRWQFIDTPHFALGARIGFWYAQGDWVWILGPKAKELINDLRIVTLPFALTASVPITRFLEVDLATEYTHAEVFGRVIDRPEDPGSNALTDAQLAIRQFALVPSLRLFITDITALEMSFKLPMITAVPTPNLAKLPGEYATDYVELPFDRMWTMEVGMRSRVTKALYLTVRVHYGEVARGLYGTPLYPSFDIEVRP